MSADEDTELRDLLVQTLEKNGSLGKIKAELRASVFLALNAHDNFESCPLVNPRLQKFLKEKDATLCLEVVLDFLEHLDLDYTRSVFGPETCNTITKQSSRESLCERIGMKEANNTSLPILTTCIRSKQQTSMKQRNTPNEQQLKRARSLFESKDRLSHGSVGVSDVVDIFSFLCPMFPVFLIDRFVSEELSSVSNSKVTWSDFTCLYEKLFAACHNVVAGDDNNDDTTHQFPSQMAANFHKDHTIESPPESTVNLNTKNSDKEISSQLPQVKKSSLPEMDRRKPAEDDDNLDQFYDDCMNMETSTKHHPNIESSPSHSSISKSRSSKIPLRDDRLKSSPAESSKQSGADYEDDFTAESQSIPEELPEELSGLSSDTNSLGGDLTDDRTLSSHIDGVMADYMEASNTTNDDTSSSSTTA